MAPRILIVDDNSDCRSILARYLDRLGYETSEAENSAQAIQKAVAERPDLILTDLQLPDMDAVRASDPQARSISRQNSHYRPDGHGGYAM